MQTFLPYPDFARTAACLDRQRLGKQRVETMQIMTALVEDTGWVNHPATRMWRGHEWSLMGYQNAVCAEWKSRGYKDTCWGKTAEIYDGCDNQNQAAPWWLGEPVFHLAHQSNLVRKNPEHYGELFRGVPDDLEYCWPGETPEILAYVAMQ